jgi:enoyl-[acyl-carrier protein] reductase/trans-2-enoyl-CoA reductase (NAD+)
MKEKGIHEGCIEQIVRLFRDRFYTADALADSRKTMTDSEGRIRIDDLEMRDDVQQETTARLEKITEETLGSAADLAGFKHDFLEAHGFDVEGIDYEADTNPLSL